MVVRCDPVCGASNSPSPFSRGIVDCWYDGIVHGFARCETCDRTFACAMVAATDDLRVRCYLCAGIPASAYASIEVLLSEHSPGRSPWRVVPALPAVPSQRYDCLVQQAFRHLNTPCILVVARNLSETWITACEASASTLRSFKFDDLSLIYDELDERRQRWLPSAGYSP